MKGLIPLLKPPGMTSHDCVAVFRKLSGQRRIGHTGTLDPNACGVLPLCFGQTTRLIEFMDDDRKSYRCELLLGLETDTQDIWGTVTSDLRGGMEPVQASELSAVLHTFLGTSEQVPPAYSAVRVQGKRLYRYAREGVSVTADPRTIHIYDIKLVQYDAATGRALFDVTCSRGTYVRTLCHDVGKILGTGACMSFLLRTHSSGFGLSECITLEEALAVSREQFQSRLLSPESAVRHLERLELDATAAGRFLNGNPLFAEAIRTSRRGCETDPGVVAVYHEGRLLGIAEPHGRSYRIRKVLS